MKFSPLMAAALAVAGLASAASAASVTFTGSDLDGRAASASFDVTGSTLTVTLSNTSLDDVIDPKWVLQALLWNYTGDPVAFIGQSVALNAGSAAVLNGIPTADTNFGGEYGYSSNATNALSHTNVITASGLGIGNVSTFPGGLFAQSGGTPPDGPTGGILSAGDDISTGNGAIMNTNPSNSDTWVKSSLIFSFTGAAGLDVSKITDVGFIYGTGITEVPSVPGTPGGGPRPVPLPAAAWAGLSMLGGLGLLKLRKKA